MLTVIDRAAKEKVLAEEAKKMKSEYGFVRVWNQGLSEVIGDLTEALWWITSEVEASTSEAEMGAIMVSPSIGDAL